MVYAFAATAFGQAATQTLTPLLDAVKAAREGMDGAARTVAGEESPPLMPTADMSAGVPAAPTPDLNISTASEIPRADDEIATSDAAAGGTQELGRAKR